MDHKEEISCNLFTGRDLFRGLRFFLFLFLHKLVVVDGATGIAVLRLSCSPAPLPEKYSLTVTLHLWILPLDVEHQIRRPLHTAAGGGKELFCALSFVWKLRVVFGWDLCRSLGWSRFKCGFQMLQLRVAQGLAAPWLCAPVQGRAGDRGDAVWPEIIWFLGVWHSEV